jgi:hypothetical protein
MTAKPYLVLEVKLGLPLDVGPIGMGVRRCIPILAGEVSGAFDGEVLPGADWQTICDDGTLQISAHYAIRSASGAVIEVSSNGLRSGPPDVLKRLAAGESVPPDQYYFRTAIQFHTSARELLHLNQRLFISRGERRASTVRLEVFEVP